MTEKKLKNSAPQMENSENEKLMDERRKTWSKGYEAIEKFQKYADSAGVVSTPVYDLNKGKSHEQR